LCLTKRCELTRRSVDVKLFIINLKCRSYEVWSNNIPTHGNFYFSKSRNFSEIFHMIYCGKTKVGFQIDLKIIKSLYFIVLKSFISLSGLKCITCFLLLLFTRTSYCIIYFKIKFLSLNIVLFWLLYGSLWIVQNIMNVRA